MDLFSDGFSALVFKRSVKDNAAEFCLNRQQLEVLIELDGDKNLAAVKERLNMNTEALKQIIDKLHRLQLIDKIDRSANMVGREFFVFLKTQLSIAMGPIAEFLIEDHVQEFEGDMTQMHYHRAAELVDLLSRQIHREEKKIVFQQSMVKKIKEFMS